MNTYFSSFGIFSDGTVCKFVSQMISVLEVLKDKVGDPDKPADLMDNARFLLMDVYRILRTSCAANTQVPNHQLLCYYTTHCILPDVFLFFVFVHVC